MQISSENYISVLTEQVKALTIENAQLKALLIDLQDKTKEANDKEHTTETSK